MYGMWNLKYKYKHNDCIYAPALKKCKVSVQFFHIGRYRKNKYVYTTAIQKLDGPGNGIRKYIKILKHNKKIMNVEQLSSSTIATLAKHRRENCLYESVYDPVFLHPAPAYLDSDGFEIVELVCWSKKPLEVHISILKTSKTTEYFQILRFGERKLNDIFLVRLLPNLAPKQQLAIALAFREGYYEFPRRISLTQLAKLVKVSKVTFR